MFSLSLNFKTADIKMRERFAFDNEKALKLSAALKENNINECVYLSTCNRCELYGCGNVYAALEIFLRFADCRDENVKRHILIFDGTSAVTHLFRVACGFESMVRGEDEILGQVKNAFAFSQQNAATGYELNTIFKAAITSAKKIKTETLLSKSSVSVATLAAAKCRRFGSGTKTVLMIGGSGEIGGKLLLDLISYKEFEIYATAFRKHISNRGLNAVPYKDRYDYADRADIIISATKSPHFTIVADKLKEYIKTPKKRLFIDLAVPRDIDDCVRHIEYAELVQLDDFQSIAGSNRRLKIRELASAEDIMQKDIDALLKEMSFHSLLPEIQKISDEKIKRFIYDFRDTASAAEFDSFAGVFLKMGWTV